MRICHDQPGDLSLGPTDRREVKAVLSKAVGFACDLTRRRRTPGHSPGVRRMGRTVCKTVPCYILSLIRGTAFQAAVQH